MCKASKEENHLFLSKATLHLAVTVSLLLALALIPGFGFQQPGLSQDSCFPPHTTGSVVIMSAHNSSASSPASETRGSPRDPAREDNQDQGSTAPAASSPPHASIVQL
jgi:hypothetical protein